MKATSNNSQPALLYTVYFIYFFCGLSLCLEGAFNPEFKEHFKLGYQQQMYAMFAKNIPFVLAVAIGYVVPRLGFKNCLTAGLFFFAAGTLLLVPGLQSASYPWVLIAFFIIGLGFNFQLVAGNPLLSSLGPAEGSSSRLNLGNALGAIAQILGPVTLALIIPSTAVSVQDKLPYMKGLFMVIGFLLAGIAVFTIIMCGPALNIGRSNATLDPGADRSKRVWSQPKVVLGFVAIFLVLGAEAGLFGLFRNFLEDPQIAGLTAHQSQVLFTVYFALFALGRLVGAAVQKRVPPARTLTFNAIVAMGLLALAVFSKGVMAVGAVIALGFFISIFFPTLYSLAIEGLGEQTAQASGLLTMGFLGCAFLPVLQGWIADHSNLQNSYLLWFGPYLFTLFYAWKWPSLKA